MNKRVTLYAKIALSDIGLVFSRAGERIVEKNEIILKNLHELKAKDPFNTIDLIKFKSGILFVDTRIFIGRRINDIAGGIIKLIRKLDEE